ncbi:MAG TPA: glycosyltransferase family 2 protein [Elusimicrobiota bacterium]|nr:glycosyltransferase family 2 protein [Elusimicrobiota bacterium]
MTLPQGITLVIPAHNEEQGLPRVMDGLSALKTALPCPLQVVVVNDGSTDGTAVALKGRSDVTVVDHPRSMGYGRSIKDGISKAEHDWIVIADADGTYPLAALPALLREAEDADMVVGRRKDFGYGRALWFVHLARHTVYGIAHFITGHPIPDLNSGFRLFRREMAREYEASLCEGFSYTTTLTLMSLFHGKRVRYLPIDYAKRIGSSKVKLCRDTTRVLAVMFWLGLRHRPWRMAAVILAVSGIVSFTAAFLAGRA